MKYQQVNILIFLLSAVNLSYQVDFKECLGQKATSLNDSDGNYLKKICHIFEGKIYEDAHNVCIENEMELLVIENRDVFEAFSTYMLDAQPETKYWTDYQGAWINGKRDINGVWHTFAPDQKKLNTSAVKWTFGPDYDESCLAVKRQDEFKVSGNRCNQGFYFVCQFNVAAHLKISIDYRSITDHAIVNDNLV